MVTAHVQTFCQVEDKVHNYTGRETHPFVPQGPQRGVHTYLKKKHHTLPMKIFYSLDCQISSPLINNKICFSIQVIKESCCPFFSLALPGLDPDSVLTPAETLPITGLLHGIQLHFMEDQSDTCS